MIAWLVDGLAVDANRLFMSGFSNGGAITQRFAAEQPELIRAGASVCHSSGYSRTDGSRYDLPDPTGPIPMLLVRGGADEKVRNDKTPNHKGKIFNTPEEQLSFWLNANGCDDTDFSEESPDDSVHGRLYESCDDDAIVHFWFLEDLGHVWPNHRSMYGLDVNRTVLQFFLSR